MASDIWTTAGERFSTDDSAKLAYLVYRRFGRDTAAATVAWRRLLQNSATEADFHKLVLRGAEIEKRDTGVPTEVRT